MEVKTTNTCTHPEIINLCRETMKNKCFCATKWTGMFMKLNLINIPRCKDTGFKADPCTEQFLYVVSGCGTVIIRTSPCQQDIIKTVRSGCAILIPKNTFHNIINTGCCDLKLFSISSPAGSPPPPPHKTDTGIDK